MEKYRIHELKKGDTIQSLVEELGITAFELVGFHNVYCKNDDIVGHEFPEHITDLYVYPHIREIKKENYPRAQFDSGYTLRCKPSDKKMNYGVTYTVTVDDVVNTISYQLSLECKQTSNGHILYEINKQKTYINNQETNLIADQLAEKVAEVLYPLKVIVNPDGKFTGIHNFKAIQKRWISTKEKLKEYYQGDWSNNYLELTEATLQNETGLSNALCGDWFLSSFFAGIYINYTPFFKFENTTLFPIIPNILPLTYKVLQTTDEYLDEYGQLIVEQNGVLDDERAKADIENGATFANYAMQYPDAEKAKGEFTSKYFLNPKNNTIESLFLRCSIELDQPKTVQVVVALID